MVAVKFGNADKDMTSRFGSKRKTKEISDRPMKGPGTDVALSAKVGGISNRKDGNPSQRKSSATNGR